MEPSRQAALYRIGVSVFVAVVLAAQAATFPITAIHGSFLRSKLFPILEYPMYAVAHYEGERVTASWLIEGVFDDGKTINISKEQLGVDIFDLANLMGPVLQRQPAGTRTLLGLVQERVPEADRLQELRIKSYPMQVTRDGPKALPSEVLVTIPVGPGK
jgi:hypothetical protein